MQHASCLLPLLRSSYPVDLSSRSAPHTLILLYSAEGGQSLKLTFLSSSTRSTSAIVVVGGVSLTEGWGFPSAFMARKAPSIRGTMTWHADTLACPARLAADCTLSGGKPRSGPACCVPCPGAPGCRRGRHAPPDQCRDGRGSPEDVNWSQNVISINQHSIQ